MHPQHPPISPAHKDSFPIPGPPLLTRVVRAPPLFPLSPRQAQADTALSSGQILHPAHPLGLPALTGEGFFHAMKMTVKLSPATEALSGSCWKCGERGDLQMIPQSVKACLSRPSLLTTKKATFLPPTPNSWVRKETIIKASNIKRRENNSSQFQHP